MCVCVWGGGGGMALCKIEPAPVHCNTYNWLNWHLQSCTKRFPRSHGHIINVNRGRDSILIERIEQNIVILSNGGTRCG